MRKFTNKLTAAAASLVVAGSFGIGAAALASNAVEFNPQNFESAYTRGGDVSEKGYRANPSETDADANRQGEDGDMEKTASDRGIDDTPSNLPIDGGTSGTIAYNLTGNASTGVLVSRGGNTGGTGEGLNASGVVISGGIDGAANANGGAGNGGETDNTGGHGNANDDSNGDNNGGLHDKPYVNPLEKDPIPEKDNDPSGSTDPIIDVTKGNPLLENMTQEDIESVIPWIVEDTWSEHPLYEGQKLDPWTIFCALNTKFIYDGVVYRWSCSYEEFDSYQYFKIKNYPEVASGEMTITVSYRFNDTSDWIDMDVPYSTRDLMFYITEPAHEDGSSSKVIYQGTQDDWHLPLNLTRWSAEIMGIGDDEPLTNLISGWVDNGQEVSNIYYYAPDKGRHVISPKSIVPLPDGCDASFGVYWINEDLTDFDESGSANLAYLQTLTGLSSNSASYLYGIDGKTTAIVPEGFQAIKTTTGSIVANTLSVPSTVIRIDLSNPGLRVYDKYVVSNDNPVYSSTEDGLLVDKRESTIYGIPLSMEKLDIPSTVHTVNFPASNNINEIVLHAQTLSEIPDIDFSMLGECNVVVNDDIFESYISTHYYLFEGSDGLTLSKASDPTTKYHIANGMIFSDDDLLRVLDAGQTSIALKMPHTVKTGAFDACEGVETVIFSDNAPFVLEDDCFTGGNVSLIVCETADQFEYVSNRLSAAGAPNARVALSASNAQGYHWYVAADAQGNTTTTLVEAPSDIVSFDGSFLDNNGEAIRPDAIGPNAFSLCKNLRWVETAEETKQIGPSAFSGCDSLEGVLFGSRDALNVETYALTNCPSMGYVASRAMHAQFATPDFPNNNCVMYAPTGGDGYYWHFIEFGDDWGISDFKMVDVGDDCRVLYGVGTQGTMYEGLSVAIASGYRMPSCANLPASTKRMYSASFSGITTPFEINWDDLTDFEVVDGISYLKNEVDSKYSFNIPGAFANSAISGDVRIGVRDDVNTNIGSSAFENCPNIVSARIDGSWMYISTAAFSNCANLVSVTVNDYYGYSAIQSSAFSSCENLSDITFGNSMPVTLDLINTGSPFSFLGLSEPEVAEEDRLKIHVPEGSEDEYLNEWIYPFIGGWGYDDLAQNVYWDLFMATGIPPTDSQVKVEIASRVLEGENRLRKMLGMEQVDKSTIMDAEEIDGITYITENGVTQIVSIDCDDEIVDLDALIPDSMGEVQIAKGAFAGCANMAKLIMAPTSKVHAISSGVLDGQMGVTMVIPSLDRLPLLIDGDYWVKFAFSCEDFHIEVPENIQADVLKEWTRQGGMGVYDEDEFANCVRYFYEAGLTQEEWNKEFNETFLMPFENELRGYMGLPIIEDYRNLTSFTDTADYFKVEDTEWEEGGIPELPDYGPDYFATAESDAVKNDVPSSTDDGTEKGDSNVGAEGADGVFLDEPSADSARFSSGPTLSS